MYSGNLGKNGVYKGDNQEEDNIGEIRLQVWENWMLDKIENTIIQRTQFGLWKVVETLPHYEEYLC
jgi:hypothetical protein